MFKHQVLIVVLLSLSTSLLAGCGTSKAPTTATSFPSIASSLPAPSPTPEGLAGFILGLWELRNDNGSSSWLDFTDKGIVIIGEDGMVAERLFGQLVLDDEGFIIGVRGSGSEFANYTIVNRHYRQ